MSSIGINRATRLAHLRGIEDRRVRVDLRNDQRASQYRTGSALSAPSRDGIAENAPCKGSTTSRRFILSLGLDPLERSQDVDGLEIGYRARCDGLQLLQQPVCLLRGGVCLALRYLLVDVLQIGRAHV